MNEVELLQLIRQWEDSCTEFQIMDNQFQVVLRRLRRVQE